MNHDKEYGNPNPKAPSELSQFAFIIGKWRCDVRVKKEEGTWQPYSATWVGRYILDGYVIADEYRMTSQKGELIVHGMNFRSYSVEKKSWVMRWLSATGSFWVELGPEKLGGVRVGPKSITFNLIDTFAPDALTRVTFSNISESHFTWTSERSLDQGSTWAEFMVIEAHRINDATNQDLV
ncbi:MAG TPA: hypothetical protein VGQ41_26835 [Pyrinomonadaceae bacterium]|jgi:hypothetical protein|nr:hypothetical protein [Pyrinomonadaceae bacterium]